MTLSTCVYPLPSSSLDIYLLLFHLLCTILIACHQINQDADDVIDARNIFLLLLSCEIHYQQRDTVVSS